MERHQSVTTMSSSSNSQPEEHDLQNSNPNPPDEQIQQPQQPQQQQQSETQSLETPKALQLDDIDDPPQEQHKEEEPILVLDQKEEEEDEPEQQQPGMYIEPITVPDYPISDLNPNPPVVLTSPTNPHRRPNKRKKGGRNFLKRKKVEMKIQTLTDNLNPIPFVPTKIIDFDKHEELLKRLGLWDFVHIEFDRYIRVDLLAQLIVSYNARKRCSYVHDSRINVTRPDLLRALKLPAVKVEKGSVEEVDLDSEAFSDESVAFLEEFVSSWVLLHEDTWMMPNEILTWTRVIKDGHPEKMDWAGLIWYMVEKELTQGDKLRNCYYASHLQYLIKSQKEVVFREEPKVELEVEVEVKDLEEDEGADGNVKEREENALSEELNIELTLGQDAEEVEEQEEVKKDDMMDFQECKEDDQEQGNWLLDGKNNLGEHFLQRCPSNDLNSYEERKQEEELEEEEEEEVMEEEEEQEVKERGVGYDIEANDSLERDGLTGNLLQGMETAQIPFNSQGELRDMSSVDLFASRDGTYMMSSGPSFFGNGSKRAIEPEHDISHHSLNGSNKRLRTDDMWDEKPPDLGMYLENIQHLITKAKMIYESKEQSFEHSHMEQQYLLTQLHERETIIQLLQKSKDDEVAKKNAEIFRLERELYLMGDLLAGYRNALKESQKAFSEYRELNPHPEEPLYKDAGPGGVVLSIRELEKQRLKQEEEDRMKLLILEHTAKKFEEELDGKFKMYLAGVSMLDSKLVDIEDEVKRLKEFSAQRKIVQKTPDSRLENDVGLQGHPSDATETQEVGSELPVDNE